MRKVKCILAIVLCVMLSGCVVWAKDDQTFGVRFGTDVAFYSTAKRTTGEKSEFGISSTLVDKLLEKESETSTSTDTDSTNDEG